MLVRFEQRGRLREKAEVILFALCCHRHPCEHPGVDTASQELCAHEQGNDPLSSYFLREHFHAVYKGDVCSTT